MLPLAKLLLIENLFLLQLKNNSDLIRNVL